MKKPNLISALAIAAVAAASVILPGTASAASFKHEESKVMRSEHPGAAKAQLVHYVDRHDYRGHGHSRWAPSPRYQHDRGRHYGHQKHYRHHEHGRRYDYRPVERRHHRHNDDLRVRIFYDLHL